MPTDSWTAAVAQALIDLMAGSNPVAYLLELEEMARHTKGYGSAGPVSGLGEQNDLSSNAPVPSDSRDPLQSLERRWNLVAGCADEAHRQGRGDVSLDALAALLEIVYTGLREESEWRKGIPEPVLAGPEALAGFFRRPDSLEAPGARKFVASLRVQKVGGTDPRRHLLTSILEALDVPSHESMRQRRLAEQLRMRHVLFVAGLLREANAAVRGLKSESEIRAELERRTPHFRWNERVARVLAARRDPKRKRRGEDTSFQVLAVAILAEQDGNADTVEPRAELERLKKAAKRERSRQRRRGTRK